MLAIPVILGAILVLIGLRFVPLGEISRLVAGLVGNLSIMISVFGFYFLPPIIAFYRHHPDRWAILVITFFFGVTLIGWVIPMAWALRGIAPTPKQL